MKETLALIAYGLLLLSGLFMTFFWGRIAIRRLQDQRSRSLHDKYAILSSCLCLASIGTGMFFSGRAYQFMAEGLSTVSQRGWVSILVLTGLFTLAAAKAGLVWAAHCDRKNKLWLAYMALSILWVVIALIWVWGDPFHNFPYGGQHG